MTWDPYWIVLTHEHCVAQPAHERELRWVRTVYADLVHGWVVTVDEFPIVINSDRTVAVVIARGPPGADPCTESTQHVKLTSDGAKTYLREIGIDRDGRGPGSIRLNKMASIVRSKP